LTEPIEPSLLQAKDDFPTICAISALAAIFTDVMHEGLGHAALAFLTGAQSGTLSTVAWSSVFDSQLVAAGGTLANLAAGLICWIALRTVKGASARTRYFLLMSFAFNLLDGTGYFFLSGVTDFGDWSRVIAPWHPHWLWRALLVVIGLGSYYGVAVLTASGLVRYVGVPQTDSYRLRRLTLLPYFSSIVILCVSAVFNPIGISLLWQSALSASAGGHSGLLWLRYCVPDRVVPERTSDAIGRSYASITVAAVFSALFIFVLGPGISLHR
jgi:hypothetical protein